MTLNLLSTLQGAPMAPSFSSNSNSPRKVRAHRSPHHDRREEGNASVCRHRGALLHADARRRLGPFAQNRLRGCRLNHKESPPGYKTEGKTRGGLATKTSAGEGPETPAGCDLRHMLPHCKCEFSRDRRDFSGRKKVAGPTAKRCLQRL